jgi:amino acid transporter
MTLGWFVAGAFTMAEICSAFPTSSDLYYWSARLSGDRWASFTAWITGWYFHCNLPTQYSPCISPYHQFNEFVVNLLHVHPFQQ